MRQATPQLGGKGIAPEPFVDFTSSYIARVADKLPKQGDRKPWKLNQNYALDIVALRLGSIDDSMKFSNPRPEREAA